MRTTILAVLALLLVCSQAFAITYIVPQDRDMIRRADAIVLVTGVDSYARLNEYGAIVTTSELRVDDVIKGSVDTVELLRIDSPGGFLGGRASFIPGAPRYSSGGRYLLFLRQNAHGFVTYGMGLGKFDFTTDLHGKRLLVRGGDEEEIFGFEEADQTQLHLERIRGEEAFLRFIRRSVQGDAATPDYFLAPKDVVPLKTAANAAPKTGVNFTRGDYLFPQKFRWSTPSTSFQLSGTQPGYDGPGAAATAVANWNGSGAGISYAISGTPSSSQAGVNGFGRGYSDGNNVILFNDPQNDFHMAGFDGAVGFGGISMSAGTYMLGSETFYNIQEVDIVIAKSTSFSTNQATFNGLMTHEMGHTLGFRHADKTPDDQSACATPLPCAGVGGAIMASTVAFNLQTLQQWDLDAAQTVYGSGPVCTAPSITAQPQSISITQGNSTTLSVTATGTAPITYQWYIGNSGVTTSPVSGATSNTLMVTPSTTTSYWVKVTGCSTSVNSNAATVTVTPAVCPAVNLSGPSSTSIVSGGNATLSVSASGGTSFTYQWYIGNSGNTASPIGGATSSSLNVSPTMTTTYWVKVTNQCGNTANSADATVTVTPVGCPTVNLTGPGSTSILSGSSTTLTVAASGGTSFTYQWYIGPSGTTTSPIAGATSNSITVSPTTTTSYWVKVFNNCGNSTNSPEATVNVTACLAPAITTQPSDQSTLSGSTATFFLSGTSNDPGALVRWYRGVAGDRTNLLQSSSFTGNSTFTTPVLTVNTQFWAEILTACGNVSSNTVTATVGACNAAAITSVTPTSTSITSGGTATFTVIATGTSLHYQWYSGTSGVTTSPIAGANGPQLTVAPPNGVSSYWVQVTNMCGAPANSQTVTVTAQSCVAPVITAISPDATFTGNHAVTLTATVTGTAPIIYYWYQGPIFDTSNRVASTQSFTTPVLTKDTTYWLAVSNGCGSMNASRSIKITIRPARHRAAKK